MKKGILTCLLASVMTVFSVNAEETVLLNETFATDLGNFTLDEQPYPGCTYASVWYWNSYNGAGYAYINVNAGSTSRGACNCKLVSPIIDCSQMNKVAMFFTHATYSGSRADEAYLSVEATADGQTWTPITISTWPTSKWGWVTCEMDLTPFKSAKMQFRFVYTSTDTYAPAWEIKDVVVIGGTTPDVQEDECRYPSAMGLSGTDLLNALHATISDHTVLSYDAIRADKAKVDLREDGSVWDMYSSCSFYASNYCGYGEEPERCECYNREHTLPKSFWGGDLTEPMYTDLHHIIPTDAEANTTRSAWIYDEVDTYTWTNDLSKLGSSKNFSGETAFEPADEYKGDIARVYFYMITCYKDKNFTQGGRGWKYFKSGTAELNTTALNLLLKWHRNDPVSQKEIDRNNKVENLQGNRNPFVDDPNLVEYIWGALKGKKYDCSGAIIEIDTTDVAGAIKCEEARALALEQEHDVPTTDEYTVQGYVTSIKEDYSVQYGNQAFWMADKKGGGQVFLAYRCYASEAVYVGDKVAITGQLTRFYETPEMKFGQTQILLRGQVATDVEQVTINLQDDECRVFNIMGQEVTNLKNNLPRGIYILYQQGQSTKVFHQ